MNLSSHDASLGKSTVASFVNPKLLLRILQRRWILICSIVVPLASIAGAITWWMLPAQYTAYALLRIAAVEPKLVFTTVEQNTDFRTYRQTQIALLRGTFVLNAALRDTNLASLPTLQEQPLPLEWLRANLQITSEGTPEILRIELTGTRPKDLSTLVNAVKQAYLEEVVNAERRQRVERMQNLERIFQETEKEVRSKEMRIENLARQLGTGDAQALSVKQQMAVEYFGQIRQEHSRIRFELMREQVTRAALNTAQAIPTETDSEILATATNEDSLTASVSSEPYERVLLIRIQQIEALIARYEKHVIRKDAQTLSEYRAELEQLKQDLSTVRKRHPTSLVPEQADRLELLKQQESLLREEVEKYATSIQDLGTSSYELEAMQNELAQIKTISDRIGSEVEALRVELQSPSRITPLQSADIPQLPDIGKRVKMTGLAIAAVAGSVIVLFVGRDLLRGRVIAARELEDTLGVRVLAELPTIPLETHTHDTQESRLSRRAVYESVDLLRALLHDYLRDKKHPVVMISSAEKGEGKTSLAVTLADRLATAGQRTVLVDLDLRRPAVHQRLGFNLEPGLADYLRKDLELSSIVRPTNQLGLWTISAGAGCRDAIANLAQPARIENLFNQLRNEFDAIVLDTPPLLHTADALIPARQADAMLLTACCDHSRIRSIHAALERIAAHNLPLLGAVVLNARIDTGLLAYGDDYLEHPQSHSFVRSQSTSETSSDSTTKTLTR